MVSDPERIGIARIACASSLRFSPLPCLNGLQCRRTCWRVEELAPFHGIETIAANVPGLQSVGICRTKREPARGPSGHGSSLKTVYRLYARSAGEPEQGAPWGPTR